MRAFTPLLLRILRRTPRPRSALLQLRSFFCGAAEVSRYGVNALTDIKHLGLLVGKETLAPTDTTLTLLTNQIRGWF
jgi:hypothetical protein